MRGLILLLVITLLSTAPLHAVPKEISTADDLRRQGDIAFDSGRMAEAVNHYEKSLALYQKRNIPSQAAVVRHQLAFAYRSLGNDKKALSQFENNLEHHRNSGNTASASHYFLYAAQVYADTGRYNKALTYLDESKQLTTEDNWSRLAELEHWRVLIHERRGEMKQARRIIAAAWQDLPKDAWEQHLQGDAMRLAVDLSQYTKELSLPALSPWLLALLILPALIWVGRKTGGLRTYLLNGGLIAVSAAVAVGVMELILVLFVEAPQDIDHYLHEPNRQTRFFPTPGTMPGIDYRESRFTINAIGLRGDEPPADKSVLNILAIGGSSTEALFLDDKDSWPYLVQQQLSTKRGEPVWVGNAGKSGLNTFSHLVQVQYYAEALRPDYILVTAGINDLNQCISGGLQAVLANARRVKSGTFYIGYRQHVFHRIAPSKERTGMRIVGLARDAIANLSAKRAAEKFDHVVQDRAGEFYEKQRLRRTNARKVHQQPDIGACLNAFEENLEQMVQKARSLQIPISFITQGAIYRSDLSTEEERLLWFGAKDKNPFAPIPPVEYYASAVMFELLDQYNRRTLEICRRNDLACLDANAILPKSTKSYYDDVHLNITGSQNLGTSITKFLSPLLP